MDLTQIISKYAIIYSALLSWFMAQFLKMCIEIFKRKRLKKTDFVLRAVFGTGGMPSSHSASITAVAVSIGIKEGFTSSLFALAFIIVFIVIRDATGVRLSSGKQAEMMNRIIDQVCGENEEIRKIKEVKGHTPLECFVGVLIGLLVSLGIAYA